MKFYLAIIAICWICSKLGPRHVSPINQAPPRRSNRWMAKALKHGLKVHDTPVKDQDYIAAYKQKYPTWRSPDDLKASAAAEQAEKDKTRKPRWIFSHGIDIPYEAEYEKKLNSKS